MDAGLQEWLAVMQSSAVVFDNLMGGAGSQGPSRERFDLLHRVGDNMKQMSMFINAEGNRSQVQSHLFEQRRPSPAC